MGSADTINRFGLSFLSGIKWDPDHEIFGSLPFIYGTLVTSAIAIIIGLPISLGVAIFISERLKGHRTLGYAIGTLVDLLAAVPSVIYGLWALVVLAPVLQKYVEIPLHAYLRIHSSFWRNTSTNEFFHSGSYISNNDNSDYVRGFKGCTEFSSQ